MNFDGLFYYLKNTKKPRRARVRKVKKYNTGKLADEEIIKECKMTKKELNAIRKRLEAATPGPWKIKGDYGLLCSEITTQNENRAIAAVWTKRVENKTGQNSEVIYPVVPEFMANAEFIANAKQDIAALLDALDAGSSNG